MRAQLLCWNQVYVGSGELQGWLWRYWWMKRLIAEAWHYRGAAYALYVALVSGSFPETGNVFDLQVFSMPLECLLGPPQYYNVKVLVLLVLNCICGYWLARALFQDWSAAVLCGVAFGLGSYVLLEIDCGRVRQAAIFPLALYALALVKMRPADSPLRFAVYGGLAFGLCSSVYLYYGMSAAFLTLLWLLAIGRPATVAVLLVAALLVGGIMAGLAVPLVNGLFALALAALLWHIVRRDGLPRMRSLLLAALIGVATSAPCATWYLQMAWRGQPLPEVSWQRDFPPLSQLLGEGDYMHNSMRRFTIDTPSWDYPLLPWYRRSLAAVFVLLVAIATVRHWRELPLLWASTSALGYLLSLGPYLRYGSMEAYQFPVIPLPYVWFFKYVPFFSRLFSPIRMEALFLLGFGVLVGWSFTVLCGRWSAPARWAAAAACVTLCLAQTVWAHQTPLSSLSPLAPEAYMWLAAQEGDGVVELPLPTNDVANYSQIFHGKAVWNGWARGCTPPGYPYGRTRALADLPLSINGDNNTFLRWLQVLSDGPAVADYLAEDAAILAHAGFVHLVLHEAACHGPDRHASYLRMRAALDEKLGRPMRLSTEEAGLEIAVYRLDSGQPSR